MAEQPTSTLDVLKRELGRLKNFTDEIGRAKDSASESRDAADAAIRAAEAVHGQQKALLADLQREHKKSIDGQSELLRQNSKQWAEALDKQLQLALREYGKQTNELEKAIEALRKNGQSQGDVLTGLSDRLQVITASLTAFRDAMNAARFSDRLESIDAQQQRIHQSTEQKQTTTLERLTTLDQALARQQQYHSQRHEQLQELIAGLQQQITSLTTRSTILQVIALLGIAASLAVAILK
ncbi:hypothetical protein LRS06_02595 [Hymenobacter sp. J193]|uniref:hypothetical protein n=1 Tax=Hymenobacter sp. J193 TaxID=2898429 RepID=UPI00215127AD|nr:hypothetical protein [Hymenobacter sp. J193]MCR5886680.1 hypothetical protein [Hymenobacter sp. J193]